MIYYIAKIRVGYDKFETKKYQNRAKLRAKMWANPHNNYTKKTGTILMLANFFLNCKLVNV